MLEQVIRKKNNSNDRFWKRVFQLLRGISIGVLIFTLYFGFSVNRFLWTADRVVFWQATLSLILITLPLFLFVLFAHRMIHKYGLAYDYELFEDTLTLFRLQGNSRRRYLAFDLNTISFFKDIGDIRPGSNEEQLLRKAKSASCNPDASHLLLVKAECLYKYGTKTQFVLLELNEEFYAAFCKKLHIFRYKSQG